MSKTATLIGVTGLIGNYLYQLLKEDKTYDVIHLIVRRTYPNNNNKTEIKVIDFSNIETLTSAIAGSHAVFVAVGTTQKKVKGDKLAYRKVDFDIPINAAKACKRNGCENFILASSVGANSKSRSFYLKLKGEVEDALKTIGVKSVHVMRPSMLLGERKEFRFGAKIGKLLAVPFSFLLPARYKPIHGMKVAKAMLEASKSNNEGFFVYEYKEIKSLSI